MRIASSFGVALSLLALSPKALADEPNSALGVFTGASVFLASFGVGGVLLATSGNHYRQDNAGWLTIESGFTVAPFAAHAVTNEWTRGLAFSAAPAAMTAGTGVVFGIDEHAVRHGPLPEQRVMWTFFTVAIFTSAFGIVDAAFADSRAKGISVMPIIGRNEGGLSVGGVL